MKKHVVLIKRKRDNRGGTVIEMTLLIPVILGCIYFYILLFLFLTETAGYMNSMAEYLYESERTNEESAAGTVKKSGNTEIIKVEHTGKLFDIQAEFRRDASDAIENIRRWQLVTSGI